VSFRYVVIALGFIASFTVGRLLTEKSAAAEGGHFASTVLDNVTGAVRIKIDGREVAYFDSAGLHVNGEITHTSHAPDVKPGAKQPNSPAK
jgi:hypothetical protein